MARFRLSRLAEADLRASWRPAPSETGTEGRRRYAAIIAAAMRSVAANPEGPVSRDRGELSPGIRSFHIRHARGDDPEARVRRPAHVLYYCAVAPGLIEI